jgi:hypothetical protein
MTSYTVLQTTHTLYGTQFTSGGRVYTVCTMLPNVYDKHPINFVVYNDNDNTTTRTYCDETKNKKGGRGGGGCMMLSGI